MSTIEYHVLLALAGGLRQHSICSAPR